jgi:predicted nucleic acid-binding protein
VIYADTNVLLSLFCPDSLTAAAVAWYQKIGDPVCISLWTVIEYRANMGLRVRKRLMPRAKAVAVVKQLDSAATNSFHMLAPSPEHFTAAGGWLARPECALRSSDALHLAVAFGYGCKQFITFDQPLAAAARKLGLPVAMLKA